MKNYYLLIIIIIGNIWNSNAQEKNVPLSEFPMSNLTSPAFQLLEETVTDIYTPENVKALALHVQNNFGESMAIEVTPYFFINTKSKKRTYDRYIGVTKDKATGNLKQNPFSGLNTTTLSFAYLKKDFETIAGDNKRQTFSIGARTTLLRFFDKEKIYETKQNIQRVLTDKALMIPEEILQIVDEKEQQKAIEKFFLEEQKVRDRLKPFEKIIKPIFKLDAAAAYSELFKDNSINGGTINRFGSWLTGEFNLILNEDNEESSTNNYANLLFIGRYIEDGFNMDSTNVYTTNYYRDFGSKLSFEFGKFTLGYEYIKRNGTVKSERSVGNISFRIDKNISITGAFGKDFQKEDNLLALFGVNWGLNFGNSSAPLE
ncbi:hypothetical protein [Flavobacterium sp. WG21]|uniref:hypothetical protein n=1 Tax=Flavobacterium sp. WG21 TaxID=1229487 RepID=UPI000349C9B2|nr:hypothetical protein [Flavobacterium sp. WG21]